MNREMEFAETLERIRKLARVQGGYVTKEQVEEGFGAIGLNGDQLQPVYEYLKNKKIGIDTPPEAEEVLSREDRDYLQTYLQSLKELPRLSEKENERYALMAIDGDAHAGAQLLTSYLPMVAEIARLYTDQGVLLEDLIGEGNLALTAGMEMLGCVETPEEIPGMLGKLIMDGMERCIAQTEEDRKRDACLLEKIRHVSDQAGELKELLGRDVTVAELVKESGMKEEDIRELIRLCGGKMEYVQQEKEGESVE